VRLTAARAPAAIRAARAALRRTAALSLLAIGAAGCASPTVARGVDGGVVEGRFISPRAYALYAIGADAEARGRLEEALAAYTEAEGDDPESADIWVRIGTLRCRFGGSAGDPDEAFGRALAIDPDYEPAFREWARCAAATGHLSRALGRVDRAILLDPDRDDGVLLRAEILERLKRPEDARRELRALTIRRPGSVEAWRALYAHEIRAGDTAAAEEAARRVRELAPRHGDGLEQRLAALRPLAELDLALSRGDLRRARRLALGADLPPAEVAVRAAALGRAREALDQAELVLGADPSSASALVALAAAADLAGDPAALARAWAAVPGPLDPAVAPSRLARLLLGELLDRRVGREAAMAWLGSLPDAGGIDDALEARVATRLRQRLSAGGRAEERAAR
jgi:tetratricopeptide (TPR) repeat protein